MLSVVGRRFALISRARLAPGLATASFHKQADQSFLGKHDTFAFQQRARESATAPRRFLSTEPKDRSDASGGPRVSDSFDAFDPLDKAKDLTEKVVKIDPTEILPPTATTPTEVLAEPPLFVLSLPLPLPSLLLPPSPPLLILIALTSPSDTPKAQSTSCNCCKTPSSDCTTWGCHGGRL